MILECLFIINKNNLQQNLRITEIIQIIKDVH